MYSYRWTIEKVEGYPEINGLSNVIGVVSWELEIRDTTDHSIHYIRQNTKLDTSNIDTASFINYELLVNEDVLQWVWNIVGKDTIEQQARQELDDLRSPKPEQLAVLGMPWRGSCCPDGTGMPT